MIKQLMEWGKEELIFALIEEARECGLEEELKYLLKRIKRRDKKEGD